MVLQECLYKDGACPTVSPSLLPEQAVEAEPGSVGLKLIQFWKSSFRNTVHFFEQRHSQSCTGPPNRKCSGEEVGEFEIVSFIGQQSQLRVF